MNIRPLHDRIVVKRIEQQETNRAGCTFPIPPRRNRRKAK